jgi:hypothetical protein
MNENHLIKDNIKSFRLLTESVDQRSIIDAIESHRVIYIYYQGDNTVNRGYRTIEPYALGTHKNTGNLLLRAWQQAGSSDTKGTAKRIEDQIPGWRLFNVDGISSWMPVNGRNSNFKDSVTPRPRFNPNDSALNVIAAFDKEGVDTNNTKGEKSIEEPNFQSKDQSVFNKQTSGFQNFTKDANDFQYKKNLTDLFGKVKFSRKQNPMNYIVTLDNNGNMTYKPKTSEKNLDPKNVIGNLDTLFKDVAGLKNVHSISRGQFEKFQDELNSSGSLLGGGRSRPIDKSFFQKEYDDFEKSLQNS